MAKKLMGIVKKKPAVAAAKPVSTLEKLAAKGYDLEGFDLEALAAEGFDIESFIDEDLLDENFEVEDADVEDVEIEDVEVEPAEPLTEFSHTVTKEEAGTRIDSFLSEAASELSRSRWQKLIKDEVVLVNDKPRKANYKLENGDVIYAKLPELAEVDILAEDIPLDILFEDKDVVVINKPRGMVVHPAPGHYSGTLVNALMHHCKEDLSGINGVMRPGIVHRIDKETSGIIVVAKNDLAHKGLTEMWHTGVVNRYYRALLFGNLPEPGGTVDAPIGRHPKDRKKMAVLPDGGGKDAITHYNVLERFGKYTYIEAKLDTGRTHQIRVHVNYLKHPIVGDLIYGPKLKKPLKIGMLLHSYKMDFEHPITGETIYVEAPLPADYQAFMDRARKEYYGEL